MQHPTKEIVNITREFLGGDGAGQQLPSQASQVGQDRSFGQQGARKRQRAPGTLEAPSPGGSLSENFFDLPGPVGFAKTTQGRAILQRILGLRGLR